MFFNVSVPLSCTSLSPSPKTELISTAASDLIEVEAWKSALAPEISNVPPWTIKFPDPFNPPAETVPPSLIVN